MTRWWFCELMEPLAPIAVEAHLEGVGQAGQVAGAGYESMAFGFSGRSARLYWDAASISRAGAGLMKRLEAEPEFMRETAKAAYAACDKIGILNKRTTGLERKTNEELSSLISQYFEGHTQAVKYGYVANMLDYASTKGYNLFAERLEEYLRSIAPDAKTAVEAMSALTTPEGKTWPSIEHEAFLRMAAHVLADNDAARVLEGDGTAGQLRAASPKEYGRVAAHQEEFGWLSFLCIGPVKWTVEYYVAQLAKIAREHGDPALMLQEIGLAARRSAGLRETFLHRLGVDEGHARMFADARLMMHVKAYRKDMLSMAWHCLDQVAVEAAKRLGLAHGQIQFMLPSEIQACLGGAAVDREKLDLRARQCVYLVENGAARMVEGKDAAKISAEFRAADDGEEAHDGGEIRGTCACPGKAEGIVRRIETAADIGKMRAEDILVSHMTQPEIVMAMKKAAAIVTDAGGLTCHAAIVSREMGIPCVIGTRIATKALADGDWVEVDATNGIVRKLKEGGSLGKTGTGKRQAKGI